MLAALVVAACGPPAGDRSAEDLYPKYCARCHGADGRGDPRRVRQQPGLDLTAGNLAGPTARDFVRQRIARGHGAMPGFSRRLAPAEIELLVDLTLKLDAAGDGGR